MFVEYNNNPKGRKTSDCVVRAFSLASGKSWDEVYEELCKLGMKEKAMPNDKRVYTKYAEKVLKYERKKIELVNGRKPTVESFVRDNQEGVYILRIANHLTVVKDGKYYDTWDCGRKSIYVYWKVK